MSDKPSSSKTTSKSDFERYAVLSLVHTFNKTLEQRLQSKNYYQRTGHGELAIVQQARWNLLQGMVVSAGTFMFLRRSRFFILRRLQQQQQQQQTSTSVNSKGTASPFSQHHSSRSNSTSPFFSNTTRTSKTTSPTTPSPFNATSSSSATQQQHDTFSSTDSIFWQVLQFTTDLAASIMTGFTASAFLFDYNRMAETLIQLPLAADRSWTSEELCPAIQQHLAALRKEAPPEFKDSLVTMRREKEETSMIQDKNSSVFNDTSTTNENNTLQEFHDDSNDHLSTQQLAQSETMFTPSSTATPETANPYSQYLQLCLSFEHNCRLRQARSLDTPTDNEDDPSSFLSWDSSSTMDSANPRDEEDSISKQ